MAANPSPRPVAAAEISSPTAEEMKNRNDWFTTTPDPWVEIARLEFGADRTHAATIARIVLSAEPAQRVEIEKKLNAGLERPGLTDAGRLFLCRMLGLIGTSACVPAVVPLLGDDRTADVARIALDGIPDPAVDAAYQAALGKLTGAARAGVAGSLATRATMAGREGKS